MRPTIMLSIFITTCLGVLGELRSMSDMNTTASQLLVIGLSKMQQNTIYG